VHLVFCAFLKYPEFSWDSSKSCTLKSKGIVEECDAQQLLGVKNTFSVKRVNDSVFYVTIFSVSSLYCFKVTSAIDFLIL
jgi:hypothetical protein